MKHIVIELARRHKKRSVRGPSDYVVLLLLMVS